MQNTEEKISYFDKYTQNGTCLRCGLGRQTHGGTRDAAIIYTSGVEGATRRHRLLLRSHEKKTSWGEGGEKDALGFMAWRICLFWVLRSRFASLVAMAVRSGPRAASLGAGRAEHHAELVPSMAGAQTGCQRQLKTCGKTRSRARSNPGACRDTHHPLPRSSLATASRRMQLPPPLPHHPADALPALQPDTALFSPIMGSSWRKSAPSPSHPGLTRAEEVTLAPLSPRSHLRSGVEGPFPLLPTQRAAAVRKAAAQRLHLQHVPRLLFPL